MVSESPFFWQGERKTLNLVRSENVAESECLLPGQYASALTQSELFSQKLLCDISIFSNETQGIHHCKIKCTAIYETTDVCRIT